MARADSDNQAESPTRGEETSSPQEARKSERLIFLVFEPFGFPAHRHLGASSHSGNARGGCRGVHSYQRCITTTKQKWYNARDNVF